MTPERRRHRQRRARFFTRKWSRALLPGLILLLLVLTHVAVEGGVQSDRTVLETGQTQISLRLNVTLTLETAFPFLPVHVVTSLPLTLTESVILG